ncbi:MAG: LacI family DNA-binding transcriptional regulator [Liquorilactobacillus satsumensis]
MSKKKPTLKDIAEIAEVSVATVSWAINGTKARIPQKTRAKIIKIAKEIGYRPNVLARNLVQGKTDLIGFVTDDVATSPFAGEIIAGAQEEAWKSNKILLIVNTDGKKEVEDNALKMMKEQQVQGIIYSTWYHRKVTSPSLFAEIPSLFVNCYSQQEDYMAVVPNEVQGGRTATDLLIKAGHKRIAFINTTSVSPAQSDRLQGYKDALKNANLTYDDALVIYAKPNQEGGYDVANSIIGLGVSAVFCHNDRVAMGLYDGLRKRNVKIPADISIVGFDNQEIIAEHLHPKLTTVALPHYNLGAIGVQQLLQKIEQHQRF